MSNTHFTVGDWLVDATANTIMRNSTLVQIAPRLVEMLVFFAKHAGEVVSRDMIVESVWNRDVVTDQAITQSICELRKHLRGGRRNSEAPIYIQTIPKRGYRLVADVHFETESPLTSPTAEVPHVTCEPHGNPPAEQVFSVIAPKNVAPLLVRVSSDHEDEIADKTTPSSVSTSQTSENSVAATHPSRQGTLGTCLAKIAKTLLLDDACLGFKKSMY